MGVCGGGDKGDGAPREGKWEVPSWHTARVTKQACYSIQQQSPAPSPEHGPQEALGPPEPGSPLPTALGTCQLLDAWPRVAQAHLKGWLYPALHPRRDPGESFPSRSEQAGVL